LIRAVTAADYSTTLRLSMRRTSLSFALALVAFGAACGSDSPSATGPGPEVPVNLCPAASSPSNAMTVLGCGNFKPKRTTGEIAVTGTTGYTTTWNNASPTSVFYVWNVAADAPALVDSVKVDNASTLGDVAVTPDGKYLVVATEYVGGSIVIYSLNDPRKPQLVSRFKNAETNAGVHTAEVGVVNGKLYAFLCVDPGNQGSPPAKLVIVDITDPATPQQVYSRFIGTPYVHDTFLRDGILFLALWNGGITIWDLGGYGIGGTPSNPVDIGSVPILNGHAHNIWWLRDPVTGSSRYAFVGEESPGSIGTSSSGDIHVVDLDSMREVAFYTVPGAGAHNFSVDEQNGILYAAYYNGGVRAIDVRGDLGTCTDAQKSSPVNQAIQLCDLSKMGRELAVGLQDRTNAVFIWGVQFLNGSVYASDMLNGIWKLRAVSR
jgi:hypothetical protein